MSQAMDLRRMWTNHGYPLMFGLATAIAVPVYDLWLTDSGVDSQTLLKAAVGAAITYLLTRIDPRSTRGWFPRTVEADEKPPRDAVGPPSKPTTAEPRKR